MLGCLKQAAAPSRATAIGSEMPIDRMRDIR